jgi:8-oxo-dGTP diphosphatase
MKTIEVAAGLVFEGGRLLITQRRAGDHLGGLWEFPGGKREPGETFEQCLARELQEELGIDVHVRERLESVAHAYPDRTVHLEFFRCRLTGGQPEARGCSAFKWIGVSELDDHDFPPADQRLLGRLRASPELWS